MSSSYPFVVIARWLAAMTLLASFVGIAQADTAQAKSVTGQVFIILPGETKPVPLKKGDSIPEGSTIVTKGNGKATIPLTSKSAIQVSPKSEVQINAVEEQAEKPKVRLNLRAGTLSALLREDREMDFQVETRHGIAAARGTFFAVSADRKSSTAAVREGEIDVVSSKQK